MASPKWNYKAIMAKVVAQAYKDIIEPNPSTERKDIYSAMQFILGETCQYYCSITGKDYNRLREITVETYRRKFPYMNLSNLRHLKTRPQMHEDLLQRFRNRFFVKYTFKFSSFPEIKV